MGKTIPNDDAGFDAKQRLICDTASIYAPIWMLDQNWMSEKLYPPKDIWDTAWEAYKNPDTRTPALTLAKQVARKDFEPPFRMLIRMLESNTRISAEQLKEMGIELPSHDHTPAPVATTYPAARIDSSMLRFLKIFFHDAESSHKAKPKGQHGAEIRWAILESPPQSVKDLTNSAFDTNSPFSLEFDDTERGKTAYFCLRWENTRGEKGPWGEIVSALIP
jgi:hypothetical protein